MSDIGISDAETEHMSLDGDRANLDSDDDRGARSDEAEEEPATKNDNENDEVESKGRRIDPSTSKKRVIKNPQPKLNAERIQGPKGVHTIEKYFEGFKFHGKGYEKVDLDRVMKRMEHWAHRLFPKYCFDDFLEKMENLGSKKNVQVFLKKYRLGMIEADDDVMNEEDENTVERGEELVPEEAPIDEFDKLIAEQIEKQRKVVSEKINETSSETTTRGNVLGTAKTSELSDEIKARIEANRKLAMERKMAREKRMEEERKRQKLEEPMPYSQVSLPDSQIIENVPDGLEKAGENDRRSGEALGAKEIVAPDSQIMEKAQEELQKVQEDSQHLEETSRTKEIPVSESQTCEEVSDGLKTAGENVEHPEEIYGAMEISNEEIDDNMENLPELAENSPSDQEQMGTPTITEAINEMPDGTEDVNMHQNQRIYDQPQNNNERLLTNEELLMEISGAVEEIISRGERQRNERQRRNEENSRWNGIHKCGSESD